jgi:hypothetical protein
MKFINIRAITYLPLNLYKHVIVTFICLKSRFHHILLKRTHYCTANGCVQTHTVSKHELNALPVHNLFSVFVCWIFCFVNTKSVTVFLTSSRTARTKESRVLQRNNQWWKQTLLCFLQKWVKANFCTTLISFLRVFHFITFQTLLCEKIIFSWNSRRSIHSDVSEKNSVEYKHVTNWFINFNHYIY